MSARVTSASYTPSRTVRDPAGGGDAEALGGFAGDVGAASPADCPAQLRVSCADGDTPARSASIRSRNCRVCRSRRSPSRVAANASRNFATCAGEASISRSLARRHSAPTPSVSARICTCSVASSVSRTAARSHPVCVLDRAASVFVLPNTTSGRGHRFTLTVMLWVTSSYPFSAMVLTCCSEPSRPANGAPSKVDATGTAPNARRLLSATADGLIAIRAPRKSLDVSSGRVIPAGFRTGPGRIPMPCSPSPLMPLSIWSGISLPSTFCCSA